MCENGKPSERFSVEKNECNQNSVTKLLMEFRHKV